MKGLPNQTWKTCSHHGENWKSLIAKNPRTFVADSRATAAFNEREKEIERLKFITINPDKLTADEMNCLKLIWHDLNLLTIR